MVEPSGTPRTNRWSAADASVDPVASTAAGTSMGAVEAFGETMGRSEGSGARLRMDDGGGVGCWGPAHPAMTAVRAASIAPATCTRRNTWASGITTSPRDQAQPWSDGTDLRLRARRQPGESPMNDTGHCRGWSRTGRRTDDIGGAKSHRCRRRCGRQRKAPGIMRDARAGGCNPRSGARDAEGLSECVVSPACWRPQGIQARRPRPPNEWR